MTNDNLEKSLNELVSQINIASSDKIWLYQGVSVSNENLSYNNNLTGYPSTAIVIQGPVLDINFTLKQLNYYNTYHPLSPKIIVTYDDIYPNFADQLVRFVKKTDNTFLYFLNAPPHIDSNLQIASTSYGLYKAQAMGCLYVLKTRSDMLFARSELLFTLHSHLEAFRLFTPKSMHSKIIVGSSNSFMARPYCVSDFFSFGHIIDMINMWNLSLSSGEGLQDSHILDSKFDLSDSEIMDEQLYSNLKDTLDRVNSRRSEQYITSNLVLNNGFSYSNKLSDYMNFIRSCLIILDSTTLGMCWPKYLNTTADYKYRQGWCKIAEYLNTKYRMKEWSFSEWLHLYISNLSSK